MWSLGEAGRHNWPVGPPEDTEMRPIDVFFDNVIWCLSSPQTLTSSGRGVTRVIRFFIQNELLLSESSIDSESYRTLERRHCRRVALQLWFRPGSQWLCRAVPQRPSQQSTTLRRWRCLRDVGARLVAAISSTLSRFNISIRAVFCSCNEELSGDSIRLAKGHFVPVGGLWLLSYVLQKRF